MVQSLILFWPLIVLAVLGIVAFLMMMQSRRTMKVETRKHEASARQPRFVRDDSPTSAVVRPQRQPLS